MRNSLFGDDAEAFEDTLGDIAHWVAPLPPHSTGGDVERWFRADATRRSVVIAAPAHAAGAVIFGRAEFFQQFGGALGYGRALFSRRPIVASMTSTTPVFAAEVSVTEAAMTLLGSAALRAVEEVGVLGPRSGLGTLATAQLFAHIADTVRRSAGQSRRDADAFRALVEDASDGLLVVDATDAVIWSSPATARLLGERLIASIAGNVERLPVEHHVETLRNLLGSARYQDAPAVAEIEIDADHGRRVVRVVAPDRSRREAVGATVLSLADVTENRHLAKRLEIQAQHDSLTGLLNRRAFTERGADLVREIVRAGDARRAFAVYADLDGFKAVNDAHGHAVGDLLLIQVAERLRHAVGHADLLARLGGDEFVVVGIGDVRHAHEIARTIRDAMQEPFDLLDRIVTVGVSLGCASTDTAGSFDQLVHHADEAMFASKRNGRMLVTTWRRENHDLVLRDRVAQELLPALEAGDISLVHQPIVAIDGGAVVGSEALVRWRHPVLGQISPAEFIPLAEEQRLMVPLGRWVIRRALEETSSAPVGQALHVNLSATQLLDPALPDVVRDALTEVGRDAAELVLEVTETALITDLERAVGVLVRLRNLGVRIALDDFGAGMSGLAYLAELPVDLVKIDRRFITNLERGPGDVALARGIVELAHSMGLTVVAEGVESIREHALLAEFGCDLAQGFLFGRPERVDAATTSGVVAPSTADQVSAAAPPAWPAVTGSTSRS
jgi:diguanylate cyclase (GGDEF)-like protein